MSYSVKRAQSAVPGISTVVSDKSKLNLPTDIDREKESVLPPGSAHPGGGGRDIRQRFEFNVPDNDIDKRPRTLGLDGDQYGNPSKDDTAGVTRRTMTAFLTKTAFLEMVARVVEAYERRRGRTRRQRGQSRTKSRQYYQRNRTKIKLRSRAWRRKNKNNPQHKANVRHYRKHPSMHRRLAYETTTTQPTYQHKQNPQKKRKDNRDYKAQRKLKTKKALIRYHKFCKHNSMCMRQREQQREHPKRFKRRPFRTEEQVKKDRREREQEKRDKQAQSLLVGQGIGFSLAPSMDAAYVNNLNSETGEVTFTYEVEDATEVPEQDTLPLPVFLEAAVFYDDEGEDAFFDLIDTTLGMEAYEELDEATVQACAVLFDHDPDAPDFLQRCHRLLEEGELAQADPGELRSVLDLVVRASNGEDVLNSISRVASRKQAGDLILYDKENPKQETEQPGADVQYQAVGPGTYQRKPDEKEGVPTGAQMPDTHTDNVPAGSSRVVPNGQGQMWSGDATYLQASLAQPSRAKTAATIAEILSSTDPALLSKGKAYFSKLRVRRAKPETGFWAFAVPGSKGKTYIVKVKAVVPAPAKFIEKGQVQVSCDCEFFRWQGPEHWAKTQKYLYGKPVGTASKPVVKDPDARNRVCKHVAGVLEFARKYKYRVASVNPLPAWVLDAEWVSVPDVEEGG